MYEGYIAKLSRFVLWLLDQGHGVRLLTGETTDERAVGDLLAGLAKQRPGHPRERVVAEPARSLHELMRQIADTDVVVATRYHNIVCALKLAKPAISIGYARKNDVLMAEMGLGEFCQHVEQLDLDLLIAQFSRLLRDREALERAMRVANALLQERLARQERVLLDLLPDKAPAARHLQRQESRRTPASHDPPRNEI